MAFCYNFYQLVHIAVCEPLVCSMITHIHMPQTAKLYHLFTISSAGKNFSLALHIPPLIYR